jgi:hypothetical protein
MRRLVLALALAAAPALAGAQMYKCKDARGRTEYLSLPRPGCTDMAGKPVEARQPAAPAPAASTKGVAKPAAPGTATRAKSAAKPAALTPATKTTSAPRPVEKKDAPTIGALPADPKQRRAECRGLQEQHDWLMSPAGRKVEMHAARVAQVRQAMRGCK